MPGDPIGVCVVGAAGRMGRLLTALILESDGLAIGAALDRSSGSLPGDVIVTSDAPSAVRDSDVVVDVSAPPAVATLAPLCAEHGVGPAKTTQLKAAQEVGRRLLIESPDARPQITSPADAANLVQVEMSVLEQEEVRVITLDTRNRVLSVQTVYVGSLNTSLVRMAELFRDAVKQNAAAIIVVHNHPSGDPTPSPEDVHLTEMLVEASKIMDVEVLDHLIIGQGRFVSLKERGLGFT